MKKVLLDGKEVESLVTVSLPMLIHGKEGSGASLYTICLATKWFSQDYKLLFLCGYKMAEKSFSKEVGSDYANAKFFTKDRLEGFIEALSNASSDTIVIVKNIELFDRRLFDVIKDVRNLIISGEIDKTPFKVQLLSKKFTTEVYFSPLDGKEVTQLEKFHGYVITEDYKGITHLQ